MSKTNNYSYIGMAFIILIFGIIFIPKIINRISNRDITRSNESRSSAVQNPLQESVTYASELVYLLDENGKKRKVPTFSFTNQDGKTISNKDFLGKVYVVEFFFTTCPTICPKMNKNLVQIQNYFSAFKHKFGVASFSINPKVDTPEVLKAYAKKYNITNPNWHLMTGREEDIYKLSNEGFYLYTAKDTADEGGFEHSGNFALIDKQGFIRSRTLPSGSPMIYYNGIISEEEQINEDGIPQDITKLKEDIATLLKE